MTASLVPQEKPVQVDNIAELRGVSQRFGSTRALQDVSLAIRSGETHGLLGRNGAGKSTAVSIFTGIQRPDEGEVYFSGQLAPRDVTAWQTYVSCLYQHSTLIGPMSVAENLFIDRLARGRGDTILRRRSMRRDAQTLLDEWEIDVSPGTSIEDLPFEQSQLVEIARALSRGSQFIILDEPTAQLDSHQIARLFSSIGRFQARGISFLYISHFLGEVFDICDRATVMRDGRWILTEDVAELSEDKIVGAMVGAGYITQQTERTHSYTAKTSPSVVIEDLTLDGRFSPVGLTVGAGEIKGIAGSNRSGSTALGEVLAGLRTPTAGRVTIDGTELAFGHVDRSIRCGVGYVPQDRHARGYVGQLSVAENLTMTISGRLGRLGLVSPTSRRNAAESMVRRLDIKAKPTDEVSSLSGGNQQKVVVGRATASQPKLLVLDTPTAGVDIASTATLFARVAAIAQTGVAVLIISNTISELRLCDEVQVMFDGAITHRFERGWDESEMVAAIEGVVTT